MKISQERDIEEGPGMRERNYREGPTMKEINVKIQDPSQTIEAIEDQLIDKMLVQTYISRHHRQFQTLLNVLNALLMNFGILLMIHYIFLVNNLNLIWNAYNIIGLCLIFLLIVIGGRGLIFANFGYYRKITENNLWLFFLILITFVNFVIAHYPKIIGTIMRDYLQLTTYYQSIYISLLICEVKMTM